MTYSIPVIDLEAATRADARRDLLDAVKAATEEIGIVQVVNHGVPQDLINDFNQRIGRLLSLPRREGGPRQPDWAPVPRLAAMARRLRPAGA